MNLFEVFVLSFVQGVTEFLPISSSAHLLITGHFAKFKHNFTLDIFLHTGTLFAVILYFRKTLFDFLNFQFLLKIIIASLPAGVSGILFYEDIKNVFENINFVPIFLSITGIILFISKYFAKSKIEFNDITFKQALLIGISQAIALLPGISRAGITIVCGIMLGIKREDAAKFSFYMFLVATSGATLLEAKSITLSQMCSADIWYYLSGVILSCIFGYIAIGGLMKILENKDLRIFSYYCWILSFVVGVSLVI